MVVAQQKVFIVVQTCLSSFAAIKRVEVRRRCRILRSANSGLGYVTVTKLSHSQLLMQL